jgi:two-component sensor histidine kinase
MNLALDIKTLMIVLIAGSALGTMLLVLELRKNASLYDWSFILGFASQALAWTLIALRGAISDTLSFFVGNGIQFCGLGLMGIGLLYLKRAIDRRWIILYSINIALALAFWIVPGPVLLVMAPIMLLLSARYILIRKEKDSEKLARASEEKSLLLRELQHRVKNSLAIIAGLTSLEANRHKDEGFRASMVKVRDRINAVAKLYDLLLADEPARGVRLDTYIKELVERLRGGYSTKPETVRLELELERIEMDAKTSVAVGLIVNELATNAMICAFPGDREGTIHIGLARRDDKVELVVADDGVSRSSPGTGDDANGLGTIIVSMLTQQIGGTATRSDAMGTSTKIVF